MSQEEERDIQKILNYLSDLQYKLNNIDLPAGDSSELYIRELKNDIRRMIATFTNLTDFQNGMSKSLERAHLEKLSAILEKTRSMSTLTYDLKEIRRKVFTLKSQIPSVLYKKISIQMKLSKNSQTSLEYSVVNVNGFNIYLPSLHISEEFRNSSAFEEVLEKFQDLEITHKLCLLSFAVFPENREVNRTMLMYWWIGERYICCDGSENDSVQKILDEFSAKRLLEPVEDESKLKPSSYKMDPHVHSAVIYLAGYVDLFKLYNDKGLSNYEKTERKKVCLVRGSSLQQETKTSKMKPRDLETVFNSSEQYPDFTSKWFPYMKSLKVLYLGRWERTPERHIEVVNRGFLKDIKELKKVKLISFQGISKIKNLENTICLLPNLETLDLKACYHLKTLPSDIGLLQKLIYLDVSDCLYLRDMPNGISKLSFLQVLKGFKIGDSDDERNCAVKHLTKLRKLSITVHKYFFKVENLAESLKGLKHLQSLKIEWGPEAQVLDPDRWYEAANKETTNEEANLEEKKKASLPRDVSDMIQEEPDDKRKVENDGDGVDKENTDLDEKKRSEEEAKKAKPNKFIEESKETIPSETDDHREIRKVLGEAKSQKSHKALKFGKILKFLGKFKALIQKKPDHHEISDKQEEKGDEEKEKGYQEEGKKHEAGISKSNNGVEGVKKASPTRESTETIQNKPDDHEIGDKQEEKGDEEKKKANIEEGKKKNEVEVDTSKPDKVIEESKEIVQSTPDDHREIRKVQYKGNGEKNIDNLKMVDEGEANTQKSHKAIKICKKLSFSGQSEENYETTSPSRPTKDSRSNQAIWFEEWEQQNKRWESQEIPSKFPSSLRKLELQGFPDKDPPKWLNPKDLNNLHKLSIKGGWLSRISNKDTTAENKWTVQILRLKYLHKFEVEWKDLQTLFPQLILLEKYQCPKIAFCPTDGNGVWRHPQIPPN